MTNLTNFSDIIVNGLNNPDCSFYTGAWLGGYVVIKFLGLLLLFTIVFKAIDHLIYNPFLLWLKNKIYRVKK